MSAFAFAAEDPKYYAADPNTSSNSDDEDDDEEEAAWVLELEEELDLAGTREALSAVRSPHAWRSATFFLFLYLHTVLTRMVLYCRQRRFKWRVR